MANESLTHDVAWATAIEIVEVFASLLRDDEKRDAVIEVRDLACELVDRIHRGGNLAADVAAEVVDSTGRGVELLSQVARGGHKWPASGGFVRPLAHVSHDPALVGLIFGLIHAHVWDQHLLGVIGVERPH